MEDRFKFRAWDTVNGCWYKDGPLAAQGAYLDEDGGLYLEFDDYDPYPAEADRYIVQTCTGLKDRDGRLIYEGDLLDDPSGNVLEVRYWSMCMRFQCYVRSKDRGDGLEPPIYPWEVYLDDRWAGTLRDNAIIGNVHEHPHLLEPLSISKNTPTQPETPVSGDNPGKDDAE
jgi:hypothetical protein